MINLHIVLVISLLQGGPVVMDYSTHYLLICRSYQSDKLDEVDDKLLSKNIVDKLTHLLSSLLSLRLFHY